MCLVQTAHICAFELTEFTLTMIDTIDYAQTKMNFKNFENFLNSCIKKKVDFGKMSVARVFDQLLDH